MPKALRPDHEFQRLVSLMSCDVLDTEPEACFDDLTELASRLCQTPIALVSLVDHDRQWFKSRTGLDATQTPRDQAFCAYTILGGGPLVIEDATTDPRTSDNPLVTGEPGIRAYAGVPLRLTEGEAVGTLCVVDTKPRRFDARQIADLRVIARQVVAQLEWRRAERQLVQFGEAIDAENRARTAFLSTLSHAVRAPLTAILGYVDLFSGPAGDAEPPIPRDEMVAVVQRHSAELLALVDDLLGLSSVEAGRATVDRAATDVDAVVRSVFAAVSPIARAKDLSLNATSERVPAGLMLDPAHFERVLMNLVKNAVAYTERGGVYVHSAYDPSVGTLSIEVRDTGVGMTREQLARVRRFQPFIGANPRPGDAPGGSGLGLPTCHRLLQLMDATIHVESTPGEGTACTIVVPVNQGSPEREVHLQATAEQHQSDLGERPLAGCRLLVVEDSPPIQRLVRHYLVSAGAEVEVVEDGRAACGAVARCSADRGLDLVLMDMQLPGMDGYEAAERLRADGVTLPIVALSASTTDADVQRCLEAGCDAHHPKPFQRDALIRLCARYAKTDASRSDRPRQGAA
ncbi:MAG: response regulator [Phycisphaeraceae bacterium]